MTVIHNNEIIQATASAVIADELHYLIDNKYIPANATRPLKKVKYLGQVGTALKVFMQGFSLWGTIQFDDITKDVSLAYCIAL